MKKLQKEINGISKLTMISGEIYLVAKVTYTNYNELEIMMEKYLSEIEIPLGFTRNENLLSKDGLKIYISFEKK